MPRSGRRASDALRTLDRLVTAQLGGAAFTGRPLAHLATAMALEYSSAATATLLLDDGGGLAPALALERSGENLTPGEPRWDAELAAAAAASRRVERRGGAVAAPILLEGAVRGLLILTAEGDRAERPARWAEAVAPRIAALLRSGELVEELSRRTRNMSLLEALGACLGAGELEDHHFQQALDALLDATRSRQALLGLLDGSGALLQFFVAGRDTGELERAAEAVTGALAAGAEPRPAEILSREPLLYLTLRSGLVGDTPAGSGGPGIGFLLVRRGEPYVDDDRTFFRAVVHLLEGALARRDYFRRAAEDPLTAAGSRLALKLRLAEAQTLSLKTGRPFSVILIDVDRFKEINDEHGHLIGDQVLREIADLLRSRLRAQDSVARWGGDEFVVILPMTSSDEAADLAAVLRRMTLDRRFSDRRLRVSLSMGVSTFSVRAEDLDAVLEQADRALYASKSGGRDQITVAGPEDG